MAAFQGPRRTTVSRCAPEADRCTHVFDIAGYSLLRGLGAGKSIESATFVVGGYDWCVRFKPDGDSGEDNQDYVSVYLDLTTKGAEVRALFDFRLLNRATGGLSSSVLAQATPLVFNGARMSRGFKHFKKRSDLEASPYLSDDRLVIHCNVTVVMGTPVSKSEAICEIQVPPSDLPGNLAKLLEEEKRADVTFEVKGEVFRAHGFVLAMRSPVFEAELYGSMKEKGKMQGITVEDMEPGVFKALLHFIYTDSLPPMDDLDEVESQEMFKHLLVAADRYATERMMLVCESILCKNLDVENVAATLVLADRHNCNKLKDACIRFINSSDRTADVMASEGYKHLKRACPAIFMDIWEKAAKSQKL
ncbi:hypothetical protein ACP4OV_026987 [Aristida adscensionis]